MEESRICRLGVKADILCNSQSNDIPQHQDSDCSGTSNKNSLQEDEGSNFITKNRILVNPVHYMQESRMDPPGPDAGKDPSDSQEDSECNRNKGKTLGNILCTVVGHFYVLLILPSFSVAQVTIEPVQFSGICGFGLKKNQLCYF